MSAHVACLPMTTPFVITTPIYYVNGAPHIGSAYTTMVADAAARYHRLKQDPVLMVTGTDEHGQKIERTAQERGIPPQQHCDELSGEFKRLWNLLGIQNDRFIRTTDARHQAIVKDFFSGSGIKGISPPDGNRAGIACPAKNLRMKLI